MCGRYFLASGDDTVELGKIIAQLQHRNADAALHTSGEIFPTYSAPVIANSRSMYIRPFAMRWGYSLPDGHDVINARSESAAQKPLFRDGMAQRRCLIPASWYFEWQKADDGKRTKFAIAPADADSRNLPIYMAGIYRIADGAPQFTILTRAAAPGIAFIHDRMPVILPRDALSGWLAPGCEPAAFISRALSDMRCRRDQPDA